MYGIASKRKHHILHKYGATPIDYHTEDFVKIVRKAEPDGLDVVFDGMGDDYVKRGMPLLRRGGMWVGYSNPQSYTAAPPEQLLLQKTGGRPVWFLAQTTGAGIGMASSYEGNSPSQRAYQNRMEIANGIAQVGALLAFISQWVPVAMVRTAGWVVLGVAVLAMIAVKTGVLRLGLPPDGDAE